jgi:hypothetical protein
MELELADSGGLDPQTRRSDPLSRRSRLPAGSLSMPLYVPLLRVHKRLFVLH